MSLAELLVPNAEELVEHYPTKAERAADRWVHVIGIAAAFIAGGVFLILALQRGGVPLATGAAIYSLCLLAMLTASAAYNLTKPSRARRLLRRMDESAIFLMIAGSNTPFTMQLLPPGYAVAVTAAVWGMAVTGAMGKIFWPTLSDKVWSFIYLAFGWLAVVILGPIVITLPPAVLVLLMIAGAIYSGGVALYLNHALPFRRALWHACVILGAAGHYGAMLVGLLLS